MGLFGPKFDQTKLKINLKMAITRIGLHKKKKKIWIKKEKKKIAQLLVNEKDESARIKVENVIREEYVLEALDILELFLDLCSNRLNMISTAKKCPTDLKEAIHTLIYAAPRVEIEELLEIRRLFTLKFGNDFGKDASENKELAVNQRVIVKLGIKVPEPFFCVQYLKEIAKENGIDWEDDSQTPNPQQQQQQPPLNQQNPQQQFQIDPQNQVLQLQQQLQQLQNQQQQFQQQQQQQQFQIPNNMNNNNMMSTFQPNFGVQGQGQGQGQVNQSGIAPLTNVQEIQLQQLLLLKNKEDLLKQQQQQLQQLQQEYDQTQQNPPTTTTTNTNPNFGGIGGGNIGVGGAIEPGYQASGFNPTPQGGFNQQNQTPTGTDNQQIDDTGDDDNIESFEDLQKRFESLKNNNE